LQPTEQPSADRNQDFALSKGDNQMKTRIHTMLIATGILAAIAMPQIGAQDHSDIAAQCSRFWGVAEQRLADKPLDMEVTERTETVERPRANCTPSRPQPAPCRGYVCPPPPTVTSVTTRSTNQPPRPAVDLEQSAQSRNQERSVGLRLFGDLDLIDIVWRDRGTKRTDSIKGRL
jgi:hypothetical protein